MTPLDLYACDNITISIKCDCRCNFRGLWWTSQMRNLVLLLDFLVQWKFIKFAELLDSLVKAFERCITCFYQ